MTAPLDHGNAFLRAWRESQGQPIDATPRRRHVDLPPGYEFIMAPDETTPVLRCPNFPDCACGDDCTDPPSSRRPDWLARGLVAATALVAVGLLYAGLR